MPDLHDEMMRRKKERHKKMSGKAQKFVSAKIEKVMHEGVRGKKPAPGQAAAMAYDMARRKGMRVPKK